MNEVTAETPVAAPVVVVPMVTVTVEVPKEIHEVGQAIVKLTASIVEAKKDGFNMMTDVPAVVLENLKSLGVAIDNVGFIKTEVKEKLAESINAISLAGTEVLKELTK